MLKLIIFDFDGTLGDTRQNIVATMLMTIERLHLPKRTEAQCAATIGLPLPGCFEKMFPDVAADTIAQCVDTYRMIFAQNLPTFHPQPFPGVRETLPLLRQQGILLTIASSRWHKSLVDLTHDMGIAEHISYMLGADDVTNAKPHPEPVTKTLAAMHVTAAETLVVGDMAVDILMGRGAGTQTCGVTWGNGSLEELTQARADHIVSSMEDILSLPSLWDRVPQTPPDGSVRR